MKKPTLFIGAVVFLLLLGGSVVFNGCGASSNTSTTKFTIIGSGN